MPRAERGAGRDVGSKGISGASGDWSTPGCNRQVRREATTYPRNNTCDLCPEEVRSQKQLDTAQDPRALRLLVLQELSLKETQDIWMYE